MASGRQLADVRRLTDWVAAHHRHEMVHQSFFQDGTSREKCIVFAARLNERVRLQR